MEKEKKTNEIRVQAIKIAKEKQKVLKQSGVPVTATVKAELMKLAITEARKNAKDIAMVDGKIEVTPEEFAIVEDTCKKCAIRYYTVKK
jgi:RNA polymerase-interacting CarD/CdnL/TRCF family regulator